jgi:hypothetical protein
VHWQSCSTLHGHQVWPVAHGRQSSSVAVWLPGLEGLKTHDVRSPLEPVVSGAAVVSCPVVLLSDDTG